MKLLLTLTFTILVLHCMPAEDRYYVLIFGSQSSPNIPSRSHTWGTLVKTTEVNGIVRVESLTISWLPASSKVRLLTLRSQPGVNLDLKSTIDRYLQLNGSVSLWGPYELIPERGPIIYQKAMEQVQRLESGCVRYKAIDPDIGPSVNRVCDCIHAITDIDVEYPRTAYSELVRYGDRASEKIVYELSKRGRINRDVRYAWIVQAIGLDEAKFRVNR